jgi:hypothetical protein
MQCKSQSLFFREVIVIVGSFMVLRPLLFTSYLRPPCDWIPLLTPKSWNQLCCLWLPNLRAAGVSSQCSKADFSVCYAKYRIMNFKLPLRQTARIAAIGVQQTAFLKPLCTAWWPHQQTTHRLVWTGEIASPNVPLLHNSVFVYDLILAFSWRRSFFLRLFGLRSLSARFYYINIPSSCIPVC